MKVLANIAACFVCVWLQDGVQQGGRCSASRQRLQVLQQRRAGRHGVGHVPQRSGTSCHTQSALPPGCIYTLISLPLCLSVRVSKHRSEISFAFKGTNRERRVEISSQILQTHHPDAADRDLSVLSAPIGQYLIFRDSVHPQRFFF